MDDEQERRSRLPLRGERGSLRVEVGSVENGVESRNSSGWSRLDAAEPSF
jgi:hypothetical protein